MSPPKTTEGKDEPNIVAEIVTDITTLN